MFLKYSQKTVVIYTSREMDVTRVLFFFRWVSSSLAPQKALSLAMCLLIILNKFPRKHTHMRDNEIHTNIIISR